MIFIETKLFTKIISLYLRDEEYKDLQCFLVEKPDAGSLIQGTGGLRKIRWSMGNKGKRGGMRIIYYWNMTKDQIYFMTLYAKNEITDLSVEEKKMLKQLLERW